MKRAGTILVRGRMGGPAGGARGRPPPDRGTTVKRYVIEREIPGVGGLDGAQLKDAAGTSNAALAELGGRVQWVQSFVADDKTFCVYLAESEGAVHEHARLSGFPATKVTEVRGVIDPMPAAG
jgi:hypothetical protein